MAKGRQRRGSERRFGEESVGSLSTTQENYFRRGWQEDEKERDACLKRGECYVRVDSAGWEEWEDGWLKAGLLWNQREAEFGRKGGGLRKVALNVRRSEGAVRSRAAYLRRRGLVS